MKHPVLGVDTMSARALVDTYWMINKLSVAALNRLSAVERGTDEPDRMRQAMLEGVTGIRRLKREYERHMIDVLDGCPVWEDYLSHIRGIGAVLAFQAIVLVPDWTKHVSSIWAYAGLTPHCWIGECEKGHKRMYPREVTSLQPCKAPGKQVGEVCGARIVTVTFRGRAPRRERGVFGFWNPRFRTTCWLIARSFEMQNPEKSFYRKEYDRFKAREAAQVSQGHARNRALRMVAKLFISHLHGAINELCFGVKPDPFVLNLPSHSHISVWQEAVAYDTAVVNGGKRHYSRLEARA